MSSSNDSVTPQKTENEVVARAPTNKPELTPLRISTLEKSRNQHLATVVGGKPVSAHAGHTPHPKKDHEAEVVDGHSPVTDFAGHTPHSNRLSGSKENSSKPKEIPKSSP
eukprot:INCI1278.1.p2 GENE.INCI1278.1~~INCI1278.1.p2  ORF type:complete len:110 (-),score=15.03 INCI1278.1:819-1148(-)